MNEGFVSTGLLGPVPLRVSLEYDSTLTESGLLSDSTNISSAALIIEQSRELCHTDASFSSSYTSFCANGLLGSSVASTSTFAPTNSLFESQGSSFPLISDTLGLNPQGDGTTGSAPSILLQRSRAPLRASTFDGRSIFIRRKPHLAQQHKATVSTLSVDKLLDVPVHKLMDELSTAKAMKVNLSCTAQAAVQTNGECTLWVERYRPRRFVELLGNERVAREVLAWVKQWDWCVFGKKKSKKRTLDSEKNDNQEDEYCRPKEKVLLISGPPGLGKTTLAHVIAAQAGYEAMEINASDARSAQVFDDRVRPALESGSTVGSAKPVLLVIDEIDGATGGTDNSSGFIQKLVSLALDKPKKKRKGKDQMDKRPLLRPIICICNDYNAHALTALRPHARQIRYTRPADVHTVRRLREICELEGLSAETRALSTLVNIAKGDMRGCLNTLQFVKSKTENITEHLIRQATAGMKEGDSSVNAVMNDLFAPLSRRRAREMDDADAMRYVSRLSRAIEALNNPAIIANGCFTHYPNCRQLEANMSRYEKANEWLLAFDTLSSAMYSNGEFGLIGYLPYLLIPFYPLCREQAAKRIERDTSDWDYTQLTRANEEILKSLTSIAHVSNRMGGAYIHLLMGKILPMEFAPYINRIISPPLRPVNSQIIKAGERALLVRVVEIMVSLGLRFVQQRTEDDQMVYRLDPPLDVFVTYDGKRASDLVASRYAVRHIVATEIDAALAAHANIDREGASKRSFFNTRSSAETPDGDVDRMDVGEDQLQRTEVTEPDDLPVKKRARCEDQTKDQAPVDFFGRPIAVSHKVLGTGAPRSKSSVKRFEVSYRYSEGNSAAVRKPIKVARFL